jgi:hypothetical protein
MITTDNIIKLIKDYRGHTYVVMDAIRKENGDELLIWDKNGKMMSGIKLEYTDMITYIAHTENDDTFVWGLYVYELVEYIRDKKLNDLGL